MSKLVVDTIETIDGTATVDVSNIIDSGSVTTASGTQTFVQAFDSRVIFVDSIAERDALDTSNFTDGQQVNVKDDRLYYWDSGSTSFKLSDIPLTDELVSRPFEDTIENKIVRSSLQRPITTDNFTKHKAFGITDILPSGRILHVYREGTEHSVAEAILRQIYSDDGGVTWSAPETVLVEAGRDLRNCSGGVDSQGNFHVIFESLDVSVDDNRTSIITSDDEGVTWTSPTSPFDTQTPTRLPPHGKLVETASDIFVLTSNTASRQIRKIKSTDFGATWSMEAILDPNPSRVLTEISAVHVGSNRIVAVMRSNETADTNAYISTSTDDGATWSAPATISQVVMGKNPPILHFDSANEFIHLIFPSRTDDSLTTGGTGQFWPWYATFTTVDEIFSGSGNWRKPRAIPINSPEQGATPGGDSSYAHLVRYGNQVLMTYHLGNFEDGGGTDLYISNMTQMAGIK